MKVLIIGAAGMIGRKFVERVVRQGELGRRRLDKLTLTDVVVPTAPGIDAKVEARADDIASPGAARVLGWSPKRAELAGIIESAWKWRSAHPRGYGE